MCRTLLWLNFDQGEISSCFRYVYVPFRDMIKTVPRCYLIILCHCVPFYNYTYRQGMVQLGQPYFDITMLMI